MTLTDKYSMCGMTEASKHIIWECVHVKNIWSLFNNLRIEIENVEECVNNFEEVFQTCELPALLK
jgi:hypothetical protein